MAPLPDGFINAITRWGNTTINISRQLGLPQSDEARIVRDFLTALHPDRYSRQFHSAFHTRGPTRRATMEVDTECTHSTQPHTPTQLRATYRNCPERIMATDTILS